MYSIADERKGSGRKKILKGFCGNFSYSTTVQRRLVSAKNKRILPTPRAMQQNDKTTKSVPRPRPGARGREKKKVRKSF